MTVRAAWLINDTMSGEDIRLSQTAQQLHDTAIRSRSGVVPAPSNPLAVTVGSGMTVNVAAGQLIIGGQRAGAQGTYVITNDAVKALTIANGDPAQPRTDAIVGYVRDTTYGDTTLISDIGVITGVAGVSFPIPTYTGTTTLGTAVLLGTIKVLANTTAGGGGLAGMGAVLADQRVYSVAAGGILPILSSQRAALASAAYASLTVYETDTKKIWTYDGTAWVKMSQPSFYGSTSAVYPVAGSVPAGADLRIETVNVVCTTIATGEFNIPIPTALTGVAAVSMINGDMGTGVVKFGLNYSVQSGSQINGKAWTTSDAPIASASVRVVAIIVGWTV
jgi:hypothetical protein